MSPVPTPPARPRHFGHGLAAVAASVFAVGACAACCVLPAALSLTGAAFAAAAAVGGWSGWVVLASGLVLAVGWWRLLRARAPSRAALGLLIAASALQLVALGWGPFIQPLALAWLARA